MKIDIKATNTTLTDALRTYIEEKVGSVEKLLARFDADSVYAAVDFGVSSHHHQHGDEMFYVDVNLEIPGKIIRAQKEAEDGLKAIDEAKDVLHREVKEHLERLDENR
jgi:ribosomal subunit interface protein